MKRIVGVLCASSLLAGLAAFAYDDGDWQVWVNASAGGKVAGELGVRLEEETRIGDDMAEYYEQHVMLMFDYPVTDWLQVGLGDREVSSRANQIIYTASTKDGKTTYAEKSDHYWKKEDRPTLDLVFRWPLGKWGFDDRVRLEYREKDGEDSYFRYRNRIRAKSPWKWTALAVNPYVAWEANYSDKEQGSDWDRHRFYAGVIAKLTKNTKGELYYCLQRDKVTPGWRDYNIAGVAVGVGF
jgi:hypothetical protein